MWEAIGLGIIQGITEFLPVSSSGHLILVPRIFGWQEPGLAFDAMIHLSTALAVVIALRREIWTLIIGLGKPQNKEQGRQSWQLAGVIILASLPVAIAGIWGEKFIEENLRSTIIVAEALIIGAIVLYLADRRAYKAETVTKQLTEISYKQALVVGLAQVCALVPGISRSAATIAGGLGVKLNREVAVKFSFLAGLPAVIGAGLWGLLGSFKSVGGGEEIMALAAGFLAALVVGILSIRLLLFLVRKTNFNVFVVYRIVLGVVLFLFF